MKWLVSPVVSRVFAAMALLAANSTALQQADARRAEALLTFETRPDGMALADFLERASRILDAPIFVKPRDLERQVVRFDGRIEIARERFLGFFEKSLWEAGFVHLDRVIGEVQSHSVVRLAGSRDQARDKNRELKTVSRCVDRAGLAALADRRTRVTTTWYCTTTSPTLVVAAIQDRFDESLLEDIRPIRDTNAVVLHGFSADLATLITPMEQLGAHCIEHDIVPVPRPPAGDSRREAPVVLHPEPSGLPLVRVVDLMTQLIGEPIFFDPDWIAGGTVDFVGEIRIDRAHALAWFDAILAQCGLGRETRTIGAQRIHVLLSSRGASRRGLRRDPPRWVATDELGRCDGEYVSTSVSLEHIPSYKLTEAFCCRFGGDEDYVMAIMGTTSFVITGAADKLAVCVALARELDRNAAVEPPKPTDQRSTK